MHETGRLGLVKFVSATLIMLQGLGRVLRYSIEFLPSQSRNKFGVADYVSAVHTRQVDWPCYLPKGLIVACITEDLCSITKIAAYIVIGDARCSLELGVVPLFSISKSPQGIPSNYMTYLPPHALCNAIIKS